MKPTPRARQLSQRLAPALMNLELALSAERFDPARSTETFTIACSDYTAATFIPLLHLAMHASAPHTNLRIVPASQHIIEHLDGGRVDVLIAGLRRAPPRFGMETLFSERTVLVMREDHPLASAPSEVLHRNTLSFVRVDYDIDALSDSDDQYVRWGGVTQWSRTVPELAEPSREKNYDGGIVTVPSFLAAITIATCSELVAEIPSRLATILAPGLGLVIRSGPPDGAEGLVVQIWNMALGRTPALSWLRNSIRDVAADMARD
jgi:DNA-binding transcriptional LysR family regulator